METLFDKKQIPVKLTICNTQGGLQIISSSIFCSQNHPHRKFEFQCVKFCRIATIRTTSTHQSRSLKLLLIAHTDFLLHKSLSEKSVGADTVPQTERGKKSKPYCAISTSFDVAMIKKNTEETLEITLTDR